MILMRSKQVKNPINSRSHKFANRVLNNIIPLVQQTTINAHKVNKYPIKIFHPITSGPLCTCSFNNINNPYDSEGTLNPQAIDSLLSGNDILTGIPRDINMVLTGPQLGTNEVVSTRWVTPKKHKVYEESHFDEPGIGDEGEFMEDKELVVDSIGALPFDEVSCPVCFGTGLVGGYSVFQGTRKVFNVNNVSHTLCEYNVSTTPFTLEATSDSSTVSFSVALPLAIKVTAFKIFSIREELNREIAILHNLVPTPVNSNNLLEFCNGLNYNFTVSLLKGDLFSHFEIELQNDGSKVYADLPVLNYLPDNLENRENYQVSIPSVVQNLYNKCLIYDKVYDRFWRISKATKMASSTGNAAYWECEIVNLFKHEMYYMLPRL